MSQRILTYSDTSRKGAICYWTGQRVNPDGSEQWGFGSMRGIKSHEAEFMGMYSILMCTSPDKLVRHHTDAKYIAILFRSTELVQALHSHPERIVKTNAPDLRIAVVTLCERFIASSGRWEILHRKRSSPEIARVHDRVRAWRR